MDKKKTGSKIKKGEILYSSNSYDEDMNYRYGKNALTMYLIHTSTCEDAIVVSESFAKSMVSKEVETVKITLNDNDILCNLYGDKENYKCFPDIGEYVKDRIVCAKRRIHNNQILYDLKESNLRKINYMSDVPFYNEGKLEDIFIYCNKPLDEVEDNIFNRQLKKYLVMQTEFYQKVYEQCKDIIDSGSKYSADIAYYFKKASDILDPNVKIKEESGSVFNNMVIEMTFSRNSPLTVGQKISGRTGNKGVISKILPDEEMPFLPNGRHVDCILNALGVINRLNPFQIYEMSINFICDRVAEKLQTMDSNKEREELLFDIVTRLNNKEGKKLEKYYNKLSDSRKDEFFEDIYKYGIFIHSTPMWDEDGILFDKINDIYKSYDWLKPIDVYVKRYGRNIKIMKPMIVGETYMMKLKQNSKKGFSARSTGALSKKGIPDRSFKNKNHQDLYSSTPIRIGDGLLVSYV